MPKTARPKKPRADFPLFPHATGRWAKKIRQRLVYFGRIVDDPKGEKALAKWLDEKDDLLAGRTPRVCKDGLTVADLCNRFLSGKQHLLDTGELSPATFADLHSTGKIVRDVAKEAAGEGAPMAKQVIGEAGRVSREVFGDGKDILRPREKPDAKSPVPQAPVPPEPAQSESNPSPTGDSPGPGDSHAPAVKPSAPRTAQNDPLADPQPQPRKKPARPADPIEQLFDLGHQVSKVADEVGQEVFALSWEEEQKVGRDVHEILARGHSLLRPPAVIQRLQRLARPIVDQRTRKEP